VFYFDNRKRTVIAILYLKLRFVVTGTSVLRGFIVGQHHTSNESTQYVG